MSITLDGSVYWSRSGALKGASAGDAGTILAWVTVGDNDATQMYLASLGTNCLTVERDASNKIVVTGRNVADGAAVLQLTSTTSYTNASTWLGILASWDLPDYGYLYINRSADLASSTLTDTTLGLATAGQTFGAYYDTTLGWVGDVHEFHFWDSYIDISDSDEIIKLISSDGATNYANPGPTAGTPKPVGIQMYGPPFYKPPLVSFRGAFTGNKGTGGAFVQSGSFDWVDVDDDVGTYRQSSTSYARPGERSFDSEMTGWTYARHETFIERREGLDISGKRLGIPERHDRTREERPGHEQNFTRLIFGDEEDSEDRR